MTASRILWLALAAVLLVIALLLLMIGLTAVWIAVSNLLGPTAGQAAVIVATAWVVTEIVHIRRPRTDP